MTKKKQESHRHVTIDELATFCKRKGFVYPSGEIYGGLAGFWDLGPLGVEVMNNIKKEWWKYHVHQREDVAGIDGAIITNPKVWEASGHVKHFVDVIVKNKKTGEKLKIDKHEIEAYEGNALYEVEGEFNPMFTTSVGPVAADAVKAYLRPETAQSIFPNFKVVQDNARLQLPFGIAQIGKAFRNEISPREFLFRSREFEQMELEYFIAPGMKCSLIDEIKGASIEIVPEKGKSGVMDVFDAHKKKVIQTDWHAYWLATEFNWFVSLGADAGHFRARQHTSEEKSHYAIDTWDLEYKFPMGWRELQGFANRGTFDLVQHQEHSKKSMELYDETLKKKVLPEVVCEPSLGVGRAFLVFMLDAYTVDSAREAVVLRLSPKLAPYKAAVLPIASKGESVTIAHEIYRDLLEEFTVLFDRTGSLGRRYARNDEIGTPFCITVDNDTITDKRVTIRHRDTTRQIRVPVTGLRDTLRNLILDKIIFEDAGELVETRVK